MHTHLRNIHILRVHHLRSYRANVIIESHRTLSKLYFQIKSTVSGFVFGPLQHIILIRHLLKFLNNLRNFLQTVISNGIPCHFILLWPSNGLETHRGNHSLFWSSQYPFSYEDVIFILFILPKLTEMSKGVYFSPFLISLYFLTLRQPQLFMFIGVIFFSHNIFQVEQP